MQRCPLRWLGISEMPCRWLYNERRYREIFSNVKKGQRPGYQEVEVVLFDGDPDLDGSVVDGK